MPMLQVGPPMGVSCCTTQMNQRPRLRSGYYHSRGGKPFPFLRSEFREANGQFSPNGRWVAYESNESGRDEIYVRAFSPDTGGVKANRGGKWLVSTSGGIQPHWRGDGKELYYIAGNGKLMAVKVLADSAFHAGVPKALFQAPPLDVAGDWVTNWDVAPDGKRFLFVTSVKQNAESPLTVMMNWQSALKK